MPEGATLERTRKVTDRAIEFWRNNRLWPMCKT